MLSKSRSISSSGPFLRESPIVKIFDVYLLARNEWAYLLREALLTSFPVLADGLWVCMLPAVLMNADGLLVKIIANN